MGEEEEEEEVLMCQCLHTTNGQCNLSTNYTNELHISHTKPNGSSANSNTTSRPTMFCTTDCILVVWHVRLQTTHNLLA